VRPEVRLGIDPEEYALSGAYTDEALVFWGTNGAVEHKDNVADFDRHYTSILA
jgi:hypothetical protein